MGPEEDGGCAAMRKMRDVYAEYRRCEVLGDAKEAFKRMVVDRSWVGSEEFEVDPWVAMRRLFHQKTWFSRVWIVQELCRFLSRL